MQHQLTGVRELGKYDHFPLGAEQGTGKTWMLLADAENRFRKKDIDAVLVIAPNGVHTNWIVKEIPEHLSVPCTATYWLSGPSKKQLARLQRQIALHSSANAGRVLAIHAMNIDAINTKAGLAHANAFIAAFGGDKVDIITDESQIIKNPTSKRTPRVIALGRKCRVRRISSGTLVADSPLDLFSQYDFLAPGLLGTTSYRAFVGEYAELLPYNSVLVQDIMRRTGARGAPQIVAKNKDGTSRFRNLVNLTTLMKAAHTFRVTKAQCMDLPAKIYQTRYFELTPEQRRAYEHVVEEQNWLRSDGEIDTFTALTVLAKLRQITSGFILEDGVPSHVLGYSGPRLDALSDILDEYPGPVVIWAHFREEISQIAALLKKLDITAREYHGGVKIPDRTIAINDFQSGAARVFLGNPPTGKTGITLTRAETVVYFSNDFALEPRVQSEDRCHRKGTDHHVVYIDIVGRDTVDERIASALQSKAITANLIMEGL
jgi:SNF2 family DNA or RNA helicase